MANSNANAIEHMHSWTPLQMSGERLRTEAKKERNKAKDRPTELQEHVTKHFAKFYLNPQQIENAPTNDHHPYTFRPTSSKDIHTDI